MSRSKPPDPEPQRSPEKTVGITPSQILEISPRSTTQQAPGAAAPRRRKPELSMWLGNVLSLSEFVPTEGKKRRVPWRLLGVLVVAVAGALVWRSWPKVPFSNSEWPGLARTSAKPLAQPTLSAPAPSTTAAPVKSPPSPPDDARTSPVAVPPSTSGAGTEEMQNEPTVAKKSHSTKHSSKHRRNKRHRLKTSKSPSRKDSFY